MSDDRRLRRERRRREARRRRVVAGLVVVGAIVAIGWAVLIRNPDAAEAVREPAAIQKLKTVTRPTSPDR